MSKKRILVFGTYPIVNPQHGGQKRLDAIVREYTTAGFIVRYCAVYNKPFYSEHGQYDICLPPKYESIISGEPFTGDIVCGNAIYEDDAVKRSIIHIIEKFRPDVIHIEQVFPYLGLKLLLNEMRFHPKIILGSQNIEYRMKEEMLLSLGYDKDYVHEKTKVIFDIEKELSEKADLVAAVSKGDIQEHIALGARKTVLAPNGIYKGSVSSADLEYWKNIFTKMGVNKVALFVGSAHPPNWIGFQDMIGRGLGFLRSNERIVFAGSISEYAQNELGKMTYDIGATTFEKRVYFAGRLTEERLVALIATAEAILLPITEGGGSNLKTAEAIVSGKKVVATDFAFRGYENLKNLTGIYIAKNQKDFRSAISKALIVSELVRTTEEDKQAQQVMWPMCLADLVNEVTAL